MEVNGMSRGVSISFICKSQVKEMNHEKQNLGLRGEPINFGGMRKKRGGPGDEPTPS